MLAALYPAPAERAVIGPVIREELTKIPNGAAKADAIYHYLVWRPVTAIRQGIGGTNANPNWTPLVPTVPDPSYPGAHVGFSYAAATVLSAFFGGDLPVTVHSDEEPGVTRSFLDFLSAANDATLSRIWAGNHTPIDNQAGQKLGTQISSYILDHFGPFRAAQTLKARA